MPERADEGIWKQIAFFLLTLCVLVLCLRLLYPFLFAIVGAVVLAVVTQRPYKWMAQGLKNRNVSALVMVLLVVFSIIVPGFFLAQELGRQLLKLVALLSQGATQDKITDFLIDHPKLVDQIQNMTDGMDMSQAVRSVVVFLGSRLAQLLSQSIVTITQLVIMLFLLFFLYRDRELAMQFVRSVIPLRDDEKNDLLVRCEDTIYATVMGRVAIAGVQGVLSGLGYWVLGVRGAALWGALTAVMAMIPAFGAVLVWAPIAVYLGLSGHWGKAALLAIWGGCVVSLIDNVLYPTLVGTHMRQHTAIILLSILGGVAMFGVTGIILGPLTFTIASALLEIWKRRTQASKVA